METIIAIGLAVLGLAMLSLGAYWLVEGATALAHRYQVSELAIGLSLMALGTSAPEWIINIVSSLHEESEVVFANVIGSNIYNLYLVLGLAGLLYPIKVRRRTVWMELPFSLLLIGLLFVLINDKLVMSEKGSGLNWLDGLILFACFIVFAVYIFSSMKGVAKMVPVTARVQQFSPGKTVFLLLLGIIFLGVGGELALRQALHLAELYTVSKKLVSLLILAPGTSLPELFTTLVACSRRRFGLAIGNVVGSNVFNITLVLSVSSFIGELGYDYSLNFDLYFLFFGNLLFLLAMFSGKSFKLDRWEAFIFLCFLVGYVAFLLTRR